MSTWSGSSRAFALAVLVAGGCTSLLGLDDVTGDRDRDRIANDRDVCPDDYDPMQLDKDGDGIGDACDECPISTHDLDADGRDDACDACIGDGPTALDSDGDGIDDGCDPCVGGVSSVTTDLDGDGELDGCDACIGNGLDRDRDGVDDACDVCLFGPPHDEDGDGVFDACDVCPADPDPAQEPSGDALGARCDPEPAVANVRRLFDGFAADDNGVWMVDGGWTFAADAVMPPPAGEAWRYSFRRVRGNYIVRVHVRFGLNVTKSTLGIETYGSGIIVENPRCMMSSDGELSNRTGVAPTKIDVSAGVELIMRRSLGGDNNVTECVAIAGNGEQIEVSTFSPGYDLRVRLYANMGQGGFDWIEAIDQLVE